MSTMAATTQRRRPRRRFDDDCRAQAVRLVIDEGKPVGAAARDLPLKPSVMGRCAPWPGLRCRRRGSPRRHQGSHAGRDAAADRARHVEPACLHRIVQQPGPRRGLQRALGHEPGPCADRHGGVAARVDQTASSDQHLGPTGIHPIAEAEPHLRWSTNRVNRLHVSHVSAAPQPRPLNSAAPVLEDRGSPALPS